MVSRLVLWRMVARCTCRPYMRLTLTRIAERKGGQLSSMFSMQLSVSYQKHKRAHFCQLPNVTQNRTKVQMAGTEGTALMTMLLGQDSCHLAHSQETAFIDYHVCLSICLKATSGWVRIKEFVLSCLSKSSWHPRLCIACQGLTFCCKWAGMPYWCRLFFGSWSPLGYRLSNLQWTMELA